LLHKDPFDRLLLAQARAEGMLLLTVDASVSQYQESVLAV
jgi:PIN domain nuclease of toxin-antitoxin system